MVVGHGKGCSHVVRVGSIRPYAVKLVLVPDRHVVGNHQGTLNPVLPAVRGPTAGLLAFVSVTTLAIEIGFTRVTRPTPRLVTFN